MLGAVLDRAGFLLVDRETSAGRATNAVLYLLNLVFVGLYVASTYDLPAPYPRIVRVLEVGLGVLFLGEYLVRLWAADSALSEATNPYTVVDLVAVLPVFFVGLDVGFLRGLHTLRVFRFLRLLVGERQLFGRDLRVRTVRQVELSVTIFLIFFIATGFIYAVEAGPNPDIANFGDAFYYTVIAVSTVGFGDIIPQTAAGRWVTIGAVLVGFVLVPWQASRLRDVASAADRSCRRCGTAVADDDRYCRRCGLRLVDRGRDPGAAGGRDDRAGTAASRSGADPDRSAGRTDDPGDSEGVGEAGADRRGVDGDGVDGDGPGGSDRRIESDPDD